jgi:predicted transcriptional regulator
MKHPCEIASKQILPALRSEIARGLIEDHGFTQIAAAKKLGTTQAAISYYLASKRGEKFTERIDNIPKVKKNIQEIITQLAAGTMTSESVMTELCELCLIIRTNEVQ